MYGLYFETLPKKKYRLDEVYQTSLNSISQIHSWENWHIEYTIYLFIFILRENELSVEFQHRFSYHEFKYKL